MRNYWMALLAILFMSVPTARSATGDLQATYAFDAERLFADPGRPYIYATVGSDLKIINTNTLAVDATVTLSSPGEGMTMSADGSKLYIAEPSAQQVFVLDAQTRAALPIIPVDTNVYDLSMGSNNRLIAVGGSIIEQIDALSGTQSGPHIQDGNLPGRLQISPDKDTLYFGGLYFSPGFVDKIDISNNNANVVWQTRMGANGHSLVLSHDGTMLAYVSGYGYQGYHIPDFTTNDMSVKETFSYSDGYPLGLAFSPDDKYAYADFYLGYLGTVLAIFDAKTSELLTGFSLPGSAYELMADNTGRHLFVDFSGEPNISPSEIRVYDTGVPEPSFGYLLIFITCMIVIPRSIRAQ